MVISFIQESLEPAIQLMVSRYDLQMSILDLGSSPGGPLAFSTTLGIVIIPISILLNILLIWGGLTKTLNIDIWNLWQPALLGLLVWAFSDNYLLAVTAMIPTFLLQLLLADMSQPIVSKFFNLPGISITHLMALSGLVFSVPLNWLFDRIPVFNKLDANPETIKKRFGVVGDPIIIGLVIGVVIGLLADYDAANTLQLGMKMAAVLKLLPKMISFFLEGLKPISEATQTFTKKYLHGRTVNIGMDSAVTVDNPAVISSCLLMIPLVLLLAVILPGNKVLPFGDLPLLVVVLPLIIASFRGNIVRSIVGSTIYTVSMLYLSTWLAPLLTQAFQLAHYDVGQEGLVTYLSVGLWPNALAVLLAKYLSFSGMLGFSLVILILLYIVNKKQKSTT